MSKIKILILIVSFLSIGSINSFSGKGIPLIETDSGQNFSIFAFYDLRDRESYLQVTNSQASPSRLHIQIFNVGNLCNENDFFDDYTGNDTHIYNMRDILTNDTNPSGVDLPDDAYGIVAISSVGPGEGGSTRFVEGALIGNFRIMDNSGYEYRTNMASIGNNSSEPVEGQYYANFNQQGNVSLSDVVGIFLAGIDNGVIEEWDVSDIINTFIVMDVDIVNNSEVLLSCRDIIFACVEPDNPLVDELFAITGDDDDDDDSFEGINGASVASFEYGINNAIPNSKGGELLCPGNVIDEGLVVLNLQGIAVPNNIDIGIIPIFIGLNNGNGRGSMDSIWESQLVESPFSQE